MSDYEAFEAAVMEVMDKFGVAKPNFVKKIRNELYELDRKKQDAKATITTKSAMVYTVLSREYLRFSYSSRDEFLENIRGDDGCAGAMFDFIMDPSTGSCSFYQKEKWYTVGVLKDVLALLPWSKKSGTLAQYITRFRKATPPTPNTERARSSGVHKKYRRTETEDDGDDDEEEEEHEEEEEEMLTQEPTLQLKRSDVQVQPTKLDDLVIEMPPQKKPKITIDVEAELKECHKTIQTLNGRVDILKDMLMACIKDCNVRFDKNEDKIIELANRVNGNK